MANISDMVTEKLKADGWKVEEKRRGDNVILSARKLYGDHLIGATFLVSDMIDEHAIPHVLRRLEFIENGTSAP